MIKAYAYLRVSGRGQLAGSGFDRQLSMIKKICKVNNYEIADIYKEQISGTKGENDRPVFMKMVSDILDDGVKMVIVESLDRLAREVRIQDQLLIFLASKEISLISANTGENITEAIKGDPMRLALVQMQAVFSQLEKNTIVNRLQKAQSKMRKEKGRCGGVFAFGKDVRYPEEKEILKKIAYLRRLSKGQIKRKSYRLIAEELNSHGYRTREKKLWTTQAVFHVYMRGE